VSQTQLLMRRPWLGEFPEPPALPPGYTVRPYAPADLAALAETLTSAYEESRWDTERVRRDLVEAPDVERIYVAAFAGSPVATASARLLPQRFPGSGYVHWVGTAPAHRGKGLATLVTLRVLDYFREAGLRDAVLETDDFRLPALRTYLRLGFVPEYREPEQQRRWARLLPQLVR
jgi:mycothiol synthase